MKEKIKKILLGIIIGVFIFPCITMGGSFTVSLIQGKTPAEAVQILAEQIDSLTSRVGVVETKQTEFEKEQIRLNACRKRDEFLYPPSNWLEEHGGTMGGTTERQIDFLQNILEEGEGFAEEEFSKSTYFGKHTLKEVRSAIDEIKNRWQKYLKYKEICEAQEYSTGALRPKQN